MSFCAPIIALVVEVLKALNLWQAGAARDQERQAGADALASAINADTVEIADAQAANDVAPRTVHSIAERLRAEAGAGVGGDGASEGEGSSVRVEPQGALRPADSLDGGAKA